MELNFNNAAEKPTTNYTSKLKPGVHDNVIITKLEAVEGPGSPYIRVDFVAEDGSGNHSERFYMSEKAAPYSLSKIKELCEAAQISLPEQIDASTLDFTLSGKKVALRLFGREIKRSDGNGVAVVSELANTPFCSPCGQLGKLKFDENKHIKRIVVESASETSSSDDLPF